MFSLCIRFTELHLLVTVSSVEPTTCYVSIGQGKRNIKTRSDIPCKMHQPRLFCFTYAKNPPDRKDPIYCVLQSELCRSEWALSRYSEIEANWLANFDTLLARWIRDAYFTITIYHLGYFCFKICYQQIPKISQSGHTDFKKCLKADLHDDKNAAFSR